MSLPRYPEYKDSGVWWLGSIPAHWRVDRLKASITACKNGIWGGDPSGNSDDIECVRVADFDRARLVVDGDVPTLRSVSEREREGRLLQRGDLLLEKSGGGEKQPVGQVVLYDRDAPAVCSNFVARVSLASGMVPRFWMYQHAAAYASGVNVAAIKQTSGIQNLDQSQYFDERGVYPDEDEQHAIATFLDRETAKIDALIAEQEKLLALLAEKRQATISHAVTRGLNPNAPMKDSGIPWLGEVPEHWEVGSLKRFWSVTDCKHLTAEFIEDGIPLASIREVQSRFVDLTYAKRTTESFFEQLIEGGRDPRAGDLLFSRNATVGEVAQVPSSVERFAMGQDVCLLRRLNGVASPDYMQCVLRSPVVAEQLDALMIGSTFKRINVEKIRSLAVPFPPVGEQLEISSCLEKLLGSYDSLAQEVVTAVALLKERRSALISAAVTGKVDVRNAT